jgi:hypothetical protein
MSLLLSNHLRFDKLHELGLPKNITELCINLRDKQPVEFTVKYYPTNKDGRFIVDELIGELVQNTAKFQLVQN